ncbi:MULTISPECIES: DUF3000 domain-containing protein [unclassified Actinotalea]|uniref:DUF3000 domain-containing protein n=1 Tax=unclassified Actinotalea TaxID=2638618 RepID=UPI0015F6D25D|nr:MULTISPECIES: DUF3000 domain-containing protein [unclassified Actinotalea]
MITAGAGVPQEFVRALHALRDERLRPEVRLTEIPAPARIAPYAVALTADVAGSGTGPDDDAASGRFVLLHDPAGQEAWDGTFRAVTLVRATLDPETGSDPLLCEAAWSWVTEALADVPHHALGGTVTRVASETFGTLAERESESEVEIRASWSPEGEAGAHLGAWATLLCQAAGLPPLPDGVSTLGRRR